MSAKTTTQSSWALLALVILTVLSLALPDSVCAANGRTDRGALYEDGLTFAQVADGQKVSTILVTDIRTNVVQGVNLSDVNLHYTEDIFDVIRGLTWTELEKIASSKKKIQSFPIAQLKGVGPRGLAHIAAGTNYPEHGKEAGLTEQVFLFPKFSQPTGPEGTIQVTNADLLDYEVEICARFDREIRNPIDFDNARKGFFLCGDFSDRATLFREVNLKNPYSGDGFADAKSGPSRFPAGPFLVIPYDWKTFLNQLNIKTFVDKEVRQNVRAGDMIKGLREIVAEALKDGSTRTWSYRSGRVHLVPDGVINTDSAVLTGTGDGVVFKAPSQTLMKALSEAPDRQHEIMLIDEYVIQEAASKKYLQPGNRVRHTSNYLGWINYEVIPLTSKSRRSHSP